MLKRNDLQKEWEETVRKGSRNYQLLSRNERIWFNVEPIVNGGLIDHYINHGAEKNSDLIEDLNYLGLLEISSFFQEVNYLFEKNKPPKNIDKRNEEMFNWSNNKKEILEKNEKMFWTKTGYLEEVLLKYINKK